MTLSPNINKSKNTDGTMSSSPTTETMVAHPPTPVSKQKLKLSCDSCASLKVACPKQQPECERCVSKGRRCTYSLACRGKRKQSKLQDPTKTLPSPTERQIWPTPSPLQLPENEDPLASRNPAINNNATIPELPELTTNSTTVHPSNLTDSLSFLTNSLQEALWTPDDHPMTSVESSDSLNPNHPYQEVSMYQCPYNNYFPSYVRPVRWPRQPTPPLFTPASSYMGEGSIGSTPSSGSACSNSPVADIDTAFLINNELPQLHPQPQDNCFTRTYILLHTLKRPSSNVCIFESSDLPSPLLQTNLSESIDKILLNTDKAVEHVTSVLQCSCSSTSSVRCALTLVLSEVISWYETIVRDLNLQQGERFMRDPSPWSNSEDDFVTSPPLSRSNSNGSNISSVVSVPTVSIGDMQLQRGDAKSVLIYLVLSRVRKVRGTVQSLSTDCNISMNGVERLDTVMKEFARLSKGDISL